MVDTICHIECSSCGRIKHIQVHDGAGNEDLLDANNNEYVERMCGACGTVTDQRVFEYAQIDEDALEATMQAIAAKAATVEAAPATA